MWLKLKDQVVARITAVDDDVTVEDVLAALPSAAAGSAQDKLRVYIDPEGQCQVLRKQRPLRILQHVMRYSASAVEHSGEPTLPLYLGV